MCADFRGSTLIKIAEMRRLELVDQAEQFRLAELAASGDSSTDRRRIDLRGAMQTLSERIRASRGTRGLSRTVDFEPARDSA